MFPSSVWTLIKDLLGSPANIGAGFVFIRGVFIIIIFTALYVFSQNLSKLVGSSTILLLVRYSKSGKEPKE